jgi:predicted DNA-binding transcriptional regulator AlpA
MPSTSQKAEPTSAPPSVDSALSGFDSLPDAAFVRLPTVAALFATSPSNVWRWVKSGLIPSPKKLGPQTTVWSVKELRQALAALVAGD